MLVFRLNPLQILAVAVVRNRNGQNLFGSPYGIRTRVTGVRGQRPRPLDERAQ